MTDRSNTEIADIQELLFSNQDRFDLTPRSNCCNCISIVLNKSIDLLKFITSMTRSAKNVFKCLPYWVVRLNLDISVYDHINNRSYIRSLGSDAKTKEKILLDNWNYLLDASNVEIYTFICDDSSYSSRSLRFGILYDFQSQCCYYKRR